jgi:hypothetical protein
MRAGFRFGETVGVQSPQFDRSVLDTGFFTRGRIKEFDAETPSFAPAKIHPTEHFREVLCVDSAFTGVHDENGVRAIVRAVERELKLELVKPLLQCFGLLSDFLD